MVISRSPGTAGASGGTGRERALLRHVADQSGVTAVVAARLGGPAGGFHQPGLWLRLTVAVATPDRAQAVPLRWQGELVEGAYRAESVRAGLPDLAGGRLRAAPADREDAPVERRRRRRPQSGGEPSDSMPAAGDEGLLSDGYFASHISGISSK